ncbi:hypothetical protein [Teredinibacter purpureus]|uniref:hypothetical protein n=1 Tax=Teredinibacter purpureus TaxID=2731756 RepID=UPI0005F857E3|nr:hypothetical protein [Teredinibacter purpureus]
MNTTTLSILLLCTIALAPSVLASTPAYHNVGTISWKPSNTEPTYTAFSTIETIKSYSGVDAECWQEYRTNIKKDKGQNPQDFYQWVQYRNMGLNYNEPHVSVNSAWLYHLPCLTKKGSAITAYPVNVMIGHVTGNRDINLVTAFTPKTTPQKWITPVIKNQSTALINIVNEDGWTLSTVAEKQYPKTIADILTSVSRSIDTIDIGQIQIQPKHIGLAMPFKRDAENEEEPLYSPKNGWLVHFSGSKLQYKEPPKRTTSTRTPTLVEPTYFTRLIFLTDDQGTITRGVFYP